MGEDPGEGVRRSATARNGARPVRVLGIGGSTRRNSSSERALRIAAEAAEDAGGEVELINGQRLILPIYSPDGDPTGTALTTPTPTGATAAFLAAVRRADALLISSPGYHGTVSGLMKNALDYIEELRDDERPYLTGLPVGCIAVAHGWQASVTTLMTLRTCVHALRGWPSPLGATLNTSLPIFDPVTGACVDDQARFQLETVGRQVVEFAVGTGPQRIPDTGRR